MISEAVIHSDYTENRNDGKGPVTKGVVYPTDWFGHSLLVLTTAELLRRLEQRGVRNADIARALDVTPSRVTEMRKGQRAIKLDEAAKLVETFELEVEPAQRVSPLPAPVSRLIVQHIAIQLHCPLAEDDPLLGVLAEDLRAFAELVTDPAVRESIDAAMAFFQAMRLRNPAPERVS